MKILRCAAYPSRPWKNGGGSTTDIYTWPEGTGLDDFDWRLSMARLVQDGPFSVFPGIDRTLALLDGIRADIHIGDQLAVLTPDSPALSFAGEDPVRIVLPSGAALDFNVMTRRHRCSHRLRRLLLTGKQNLVRSSPSTIIFLARGASVQCGTGASQISLKRHDALILDAEDVGEIALTAAQGATILIIDISPANASNDET